MNREKNISAEYRTVNNRPNNRDLRNGNIPLASRHRKLQCTRYLRSIADYVEDTDTVAVVHAMEREKK